MAYSTWTGGSNDGNWATAGNWDTGGGGSAPPGAGDDVYIDKTSQDITTWPASVTLGVLYIRSGYTGNIESTAGAALTMAGTTLNISRTAGGVIKIAGSFSTATNVYSTGSGAVHLMTSGTHAQLNMGIGTRVIVDGSAVVTNYENDGGSLDIAYNATAVTLGETYNGGRTLSHRVHTTLRAEGGSQVTIRQKGTTAITVTTANVNSRALFLHESAGTITTVNNWGTVSAGASPFNFTITTYKGRPGSTLVENSSTGATVTVTNRTPVAIP